MRLSAVGDRPSADIHKGTMQDFRNIDVWHVAHQLTLDVYEATRDFPKHELYGLTSQLRRSSSSIPTNIAEGCTRRTDTDFARFLYNAISSASEVEYLLHLSHDLRYIATNQFDSLTAEAQRAKRMLAAFIRRLESDVPVQTERRQPIADSR